MGRLGRVRRLVRRMPGRAALILFACLGACAEALPAEREQDTVTQLAPAATGTSRLCGAGDLPEGVLLDVGSMDDPDVIGTAADRVLSQDRDRWILWDARSGLRVAEGRAGFAIDMVGDVLLTPGEAGLDLRSARDGSRLVTFPVTWADGVTAGLADDASYVFIADADALRGFSPSGRVLFEVLGDHRFAHVSAQPSRLHAVLTARSLVETVAVSDGATTLSRTYVDAFYKWFRDGRHFITASNAWFNIYTAEGNFVRRVAFQDGPVEPPWTPSGGGDGNFVWVGNHNAEFVRAYPLDGGAPFVMRANQRKTSRRSTSFAFEVEDAGGTASLVRLNLRGEQPRLEPAPAPPDEKPRYIARSFSEHPSGLLAVASFDGTIRVLDVKAPSFVRLLGCGRPEAMAAAPGRVAVVTGDRRLRVFDLRGSKAELLRTLILDGVSSPTLGFAGDGRFLVLIRESYERPNERTRTVLAYDLQREAGSAAFADPVEVVRTRLGVSIAPAARAPYVAISACGGRGPCDVSVRAIDGSGDSWSVRVTRPEHVERMGLSPGGTRVALYQPDRLIFTEIHERAGILASDTFRFSFWLDDDRWIDSASSDATVRDAHGVQVGSLPADDLEVGWGDGARSNHPAYFLDDQGSVYRTSDFARIWDIHRFHPEIRIGRFPHTAALRDHYTGSATAGDLLVVGVDGRVHLEPLR